MAEEFSTEVDLPAPVEEVFRHLTDPAAMVRWMGQHATLTPVPGGAFEVDINGVPVRGRYLEVSPPHRVLVSWGVAGSADMPPGATEVEFTLTPVAGAPGSGSCTVAWFRARKRSTPLAGSSSSACSFEHQGQQPGKVGALRPG